MDEFNEIEDYNDEDCENEEPVYEEMDIKIINFIKMLNNQENEKAPNPSKYSISTQSGMAYTENITSVNLSKIVVYIGKNIINNIALGKNPQYLIRGLVVDNIIIRFDESYLKKYKKPYIKYMNNQLDPYSMEDCVTMLGSIDALESNSLKKHGRQKKKKDNEYFYNSCSIIVKANSETKCVNIKLFNNGKITLTGSKAEVDGYTSCCVLLEELKKVPAIFIEFDKHNEEYIKNLEGDDTFIQEERLKIISAAKISNYRITMINSNFNTNFKIDLLKLLEILNSDKYMLFTKFNPEKYRGLIIGYYWNTSYPTRDGKCKCIGKCGGKGNGNGNGNCKKVTISVFKSGSIIITGGCLIEQVDDAYKTINTILRDNYTNIVKLSILDFISDTNNEDQINDDDLEMHNIKNIFKQTKKEGKISKDGKITKEEKIKKTKKEGKLKKINKDDNAKIKNKDLIDSMANTSDGDSKKIKIKKMLIL